MLEPVIPAKAKVFDNPTRSSHHVYYIFLLFCVVQDEIAQTLVYILQLGGKVKDFLCDIVMAEVKNIGQFFF